MARSLVAALGALALLAALPQPGRAHARLVQSTPAANQDLAEAPRLVAARFEEAVNPELSRLEVYDQGRHRRDRGAPRQDAADPRQLTVDLEPLGPGFYTVIWTTVATGDGHVSRGAFAFRVLGSAPAAGPAAEVIELGARPPGLVTLAVGVKMLLLLALVTWLGALALAVAFAGLPPSPFDLASPGPSPVDFLPRLAPVAFIVVVAASLGEILSQMLLLANGFSASYVNLSTLGSLLFSTNWGSAWRARLLLLIALVVACRGRAPGDECRVAGGEGGATGEALRATTGLTEAVQAPPAPRLLGRLPPRLLGTLGLAVLGCQALMGHAAEVPDLVYSSVTLDTLHLVGSALWVGITLATALLLLGGAPWPLAAGARPHLGLVWLGVGMLGVSGLFNAEQHVARAEQLTATLYGQALLVKLSLVALLLALGVVVNHWWAPRLATSPAVTAQRLARLGRAGSLTAAACGVGVLGCVAVMDQFPLPQRVVGASQRAGLPPVVGRPVQQSRDAAGMRVGITLRPGLVGNNHLGASVTDDGGAPLAGLRVRVRLEMLEMDMGVAARNGVTDAQGQYRLDFNFDMEGEWQAVIDVDRPGQARQSVPFRFPIGTVAAPPAGGA